MNINQVVRLLNEVNRKTISGTNSLEEFHGQNENYYKLEKKKEEWIFSFVVGERKKEEEENTRKVFDNEDGALTFYYLYELSGAYRKQYIHLFERKNEDISIGEPTCTILNLKKAFERLGIKKSYYNFENVKNEHSICLEEVSKDTSIVKFIGNGNKIILETLKLENWLAYYAMYMRVYSLFLLDRHCELLIKNKEIEAPFSDEEYKNFIK